MFYEKKYPRPFKQQQNNKDKQTKLNLHLLNAAVALTIMNNYYSLCGTKMTLGFVEGDVCLHTFNLSYGKTLFLCHL